jgi:hypothetical protein
MSTFNHPDFEEVIASRTITAYLGVSLQRDYCSPLRSENNASFTVFIGTRGNQMWKDHGNNTSGDLIKLHSLLRGCSLDTAAQELMAWDGVSVVHQVERGTGSRGNGSTGHGTDANKPGTPSSKPIGQSLYIRQTGLPVPPWVVDGLKLFTDTRNNLCLPTSGGTHYKGAKIATGKTFAGNLGLAGYSVCGNVQGGKWLIVEGVGDLLATIDILGSTEKNYAYLLLNSTSTRNKAMAYLKEQEIVELALLLDKDQAGDDTTALFQKSFEGQKVYDIRDLIKHGKDIKDTWANEHRIAA